MTHDSGRHRVALRRVALPCALLLGLSGVTGCGDDEKTGTEGTVDVDKVGEKVTVRGEVDQVVDSHAFTVTGTKITSLDELLVVSAADAEMSEGVEVTVKGVLLEDFDAVRVGKDLGFDWKPDPYQAWNGEHYVLAAKVEK